MIEMNDRKKTCTNTEKQQNIFATILSEVIIIIYYFYRGMFLMRIMCIKICVDMCIVTIDYNIFITKYLHKPYSVSPKLKVQQQRSIHIILMTHCTFMLSNFSGSNYRMPKLSYKPLESLPNRNRVQKIRHLRRQNRLTQFS